MIGQTIANYKILKELGTGGMGTVYLAENQSIGNKVAIKMLHPHLVKSENIKTRFLKEARTQAIMDHPNITKVIDFVSNDQGLFIILEFVEGEPLNDFLFRSKGLLPEKDANHYMAKILDAVGYAHDKGIVHRDLKTANIMVTPNRGIKIMDFGIAKLANETMSLTKTGSRLGSPLYMSPEQVTNGQVDYRSDIYSLGVVYHEMLTGTPVYDQNNTTEFEIYNKIVKEPLPRLRDFYKMNSEKAQQVVDTATAKLPIARFQSCEQFKKELLNGATNLNLHPPVPKRNSDFQSIEKKQNTPGKPNTVNVLIIGSLILLLLGVAIYFWNQTKGINKSISFEKIRDAEDFTDAGNFRAALSIYENLLDEFPNETLVHRRISDLKNDSESFQQKHIDSILNIYLQIRSLENFDTADSILNYKLLQGFEAIDAQLNHLKNQPRVIGGAVRIKETKSRLHELRDSLSRAVAMKQAMQTVGTENGAPIAARRSSVSFSEVEIPPIFPGCSELTAALQKRCFEIKINEYLQQNLPIKLYADQGWAKGRQVCNYYFTVTTDGRLRDVAATSPKLPQIAQDAIQALGQLRGTKPGFHGQMPVNVFYRGSLEMNFPKKISDGSAFETATEIANEVTKMESGPRPDHISMEMADKAPIFPGCEGQGGMALVRCTSNKINDYIKDHIDYDKLSRAGLPKGNQRIFLKFRITDRGEVENIVVRAPLVQLEQEVSRILRILPKMEPGIFNGAVAPIEYNVGLVVSIN